MLPGESGGRSLSESLINRSAGDRLRAQQIPEHDAEEVGYIREQLFFRNLIAVLPAGDGPEHEVEHLVTAGPGHALLFPEDPEFGSE